MQVYHALPAPDVASNYGHGNNSEKVGQRDWPRESPEAYELSYEPGDRGEGAKNRQ
jgi:hypothetical protein